MNGNQTDVKNTKTGENQTYVYDAENRLSQVSVTKDGKTSVIQQNIYNGEGQRIQKVDGDEMTNYYYQDGVAAYTTDADGNQNSQNLIGTEGNVGAVAGSYKGRLVAKRLGYKGKIIEGTCIAKKGVVKLSDAWVKQLVYDNQPFFLQYKLEKRIESYAGIGIFISDKFVNNGYFSFQGSNVFSRASIQSLSVSKR